MKPNLILGTMTFGQQTFLEEATEMTQLFLSKGYRELDTAYVYNEGECEKLLGQLIAKVGREQVTIATKVNPRITGRLDGDAVNKQLPESLERMGIDYADILYLHFPDVNTPVESALAACDALHRQGKFRELGLSNFPAWMVLDVYHKCKANGWVLPTVFEGVYNPLTRGAEQELFDALRTLNIRFCCYNPLAGGMLTGKYTDINQNPTDGRFTLRKAYPGRYWKQSFFDAVALIKQACGDRMAPAEAAYRWLAYHSHLDMERGDAIIIGASKISQFRQNLAAVENGPLPEDLVRVFDQAWALCRGDAPTYFTLYRG